VIEKSDIRRALKEIKPASVSPKRRSSKYCLIVRGRHYPSKQVVRLAYEIKHNRTAGGLFRGGRQIIEILKPMGYSVMPCKRLPNCQDWCIAS
jgi:hypothetical protein